MNGYGNRAEKVAGGEQPSNRVLFISFGHRPNFSAS
jgi:hypothetical protein